VCCQTISARGLTLRSNVTVFELVTLSDTVVLKHHRLGRTSLTATVRGSTIYCVTGDTVNTHHYFDWTRSRTDSNTMYWVSPSQPTQLDCSHTNHRRAGSVQLLLFCLCRNLLPRHSMSAGCSFVWAGRQ